MSDDLNNCSPIPAASRTPDEKVKLRASSSAPASSPPLSGTAVSAAAVAASDDPARPLTPQQFDALPMVEPTCPVHGFGGWPGGRNGPPPPGSGSGSGSAGNNTKHRLGRIFTFGNVHYRGDAADASVCNTQSGHDANGAVRKCTCTRKTPLVDLRAERAVIRTNEQRHAKSQHEQLRQYKDEAKHLSRVSRAFREENARLQRVLEEKSRRAADAEERAAREERRQGGADDERQAWLGKLEDLRGECDMMTDMASKARSEADHLRAALQQAIGENLKLRSAMTAPQQSQQSQPQPQQQQQQQQQVVVVGGALPPVSRPHHHQMPTAIATTTAGASSATEQLLASATAASKTATPSAKDIAVHLVEDLNTLRAAVNEIRGVAAGSCEHRCAVATTNHRFSPFAKQQHQQRDDTGATTAPPPVPPVIERLDRAMDSIRHRVFTIEKEMQTTQQETARWRAAAEEMKALLDAANSRGEHAVPGQQQRQQDTYAPPATAATTAVPSVPSNTNTNDVVRHSGKVDLPGPNPRSATAGVTNLESQLAWAKGQIATLDFQLRETQAHMDAELAAARRERDAAVADASAQAAAATERRVRDEVRTTTSGAFLEELSQRQQQAERQIANLDMAATTSEATKRQQRAEIATLRDELEKQTALADQLEPTQRELAAAREDLNVMAIKLNHAEATADGLRASEARCTEEIATLRARASGAEEHAQGLQTALTQARLQHHQEAEANKELRERLEGTIERDAAAARESQQLLQGELAAATERLGKETSQRVVEEARCGALECNLRSVREEVERIRRVQLHW